MCAQRGEEMSYHLKMGIMTHIFRQSLLEDIVIALLMVVYVKTSVSCVKNVKRDLKREV